MFGICARSLSGGRYEGEGGSHDDEDDGRARRQIAAIFRGCLKEQSPMTYYDRCCWDDVSLSGFKQMMFIPNFKVESTESFMR
jgi:hypothetical protein